MSIYEEKGVFTTQKNVGPDYLILCVHILYSKHGFPPDYKLPYAQTSVVWLQCSNTCCSFFFLRKQADFTFWKIWKNYCKHLFP